MTSLAELPVIVAPAVETVKLVEEVPAFIVVMEFGRHLLKIVYPNLLY